MNAACRYLPERRAFEPGPLTPVDSWSRAEDGALCFWDPMGIPVVDPSIPVRIDNQGAGSSDAIVWLRFREHHQPIPCSVPRASIRPIPLPMSAAVLEVSGLSAKTAACAWPDGLVFGRFEKSEGRGRQSIRGAQGFARTWTLDLNVVSLPDLTIGFLPLPVVGGGSYRSLVVRNGGDSGRWRAKLLDEGYQTLAESPLAEHADGAVSILGSTRAPTHLWIERSDANGDSATLLTSLPAAERTTCLAGTLDIDFDGTFVGFVASFGDGGRWGRLSRSPGSNVVPHLTDSPASLRWRLGLPPAWRKWAAQAADDRDASPEEGLLTILLASAFRWLPIAERGWTIRLGRGLAGAGWSLDRSDLRRIEQNLRTSGLPRLEFRAPSMQSALAGIGRHLPTGVPVAVGILLDLRWDSLGLGLVMTTGGDGKGDTIAAIASDVVPFGLNELSDAAMARTSHDISVDVQRAHAFLQIVLEETARWVSLGLTDATMSSAVPELSGDDRAELRRMVASAVRNGHDAVPVRLWLDGYGWKEVLHDIDDATIQSRLTKAFGVIAPRIVARRRQQDLGALSLAAMSSDTYSFVDEHGCAQRPAGPAGAKGRLVSGMRFDEETFLTASQWSEGYTVAGEGEYTGEASPFAREVARRLRDRCRPSTSGLSSNKARVPSETGLVSNHRIGLNGYRAIRIGLFSATFRNAYTSVREGFLLGQGGAADDWIQSAIEATDRGTIQTTWTSSGRLSAKSKQSWNGTLTRLKRQSTTGVMIRTDGDKWIIGADISVGVEVCLLSSERVIRLSDSIETTQPPDVLFLLSDGYREVLFGHDINELHDVRNWSYIIDDLRRGGVLDADPARGADSLVRWQQSAGLRDTAGGILILIRMKDKS